MSVATLQSLLNQIGYKLEYAIASPDYKRPSVDRGSVTCDSEIAVYSEIIDHLCNAFIIQADSYDHAVSEPTDEETKNLRIVWNRCWGDDESEEADTANDEPKPKKARADQTEWLAAAKAVTKMANDGRFSDYVYSDSYMDEPAFQFDVTREPFVFSYVYKDECDEIVLETVASDVDELVRAYNSYCARDGFLCEVTVL